MDNQMKLNDVKGIHFIGGQITSRIEVNQKKNDVAVGKIKVIPPKAIKNGMIDHGELYELEYKAEFDEKKLTKAGDIVVKLSSPYDAAMITEQDEGYLITSFCIIIRNNSKIFLSEYIGTFFNSGVYLRQAMNMVSGATVPMLTIGKVKEVQIRSLTLEEQRQVAEYYFNLCEKEKTMQRIIELEKEKLDTILGGNYDR